MKQSYLLFAALITLAACGKNENVQPSREDGVSVVMYDVACDTLASMGDTEGKEKRPFYSVLFSFANKSTRFIKTAADSAQYLKQTDWDIAFTQEYNSYVTVNGQFGGTPGNGGPGKGVMVSVNTPYDQVTEAPADETFTREGVGGTGWDTGSGYGWFFYSLTNHICVPIKNRTFILRTATGKYAKLELLNIYKGNPAVVTDLFWPAPYVSFRYFVQEDGSKNLRTK